jgi:hypothetical protein
MKAATERTAISTMVFAATAIVLIIVAAVGFGLYATNSGKTTTSTSTSTTTITSTLMQELQSGGFLNNQTVKFGYTQAQVCTPSVISFGFNSSEATAAAGKTQCEVGAGNSTAVSGAAPVFVLVPAYAGLSVFGVTTLGASSQGYPVFDGQVIVTQCGAGGTNASCPDHPTYLYSPDFTAVEQHIGVTNGVFGLPEGVLPTPAHDHVITFLDSSSIPWYMVAVLVFDPNVMPNAITGQCQQIVNSNLTDPTQNCLNSVTAIAAALTTHTTATAAANATQNNPIYDTFGGVSTQVLIPGVTMVAANSPANSNLFLYFNDIAENPYA